MMIHQLIACCAKLDPKVVFKDVVKKDALPCIVPVKIWRALVDILGSRYKQTPAPTAAQDTCETQIKITETHETNFTTFVSAAGTKNAPITVLPPPKAASSSAPSAGVPVLKKSQNRCSVGWRKGLKSFNEDGKAADSFLARTDSE
eukprot:11613517-Ditylum_brightwellii.AAC.1